MPRLAKALLSFWWYPEVALGYARIGLREAEAARKPLEIREWRSAIRWLRWIAGRADVCDWRAPTLPEFVQETFAERA
ncbi:MAG: hypothetical protein IH945_01655 [Armatimonadetes bacterium]|nr:hypothetical protein [Armatimonadota bacterium]